MTGSALPAPACWWQASDLVFIAGIALFGLSDTATRRACVVLGAAILGTGVLAWLRSAEAQRHADPGASLLWSYSGYAAAACLTALIALPVVDQSQNLGSLARRIRSDTELAQLALLDPDETTLAVLDHGFTAPVAAIVSDAAGKQRAVSDWFAAHPQGGRVLVLLPGHASGKLRRWLGQFHTDPDPGDGVAAVPIDAGAARLVRRYELPQGRRYALLEPPGP